MATTHGRLRAPFPVWAGGAVLGVFIVDSSTPLGIEIWVFYLPVILSLVFSHGPRPIAALAGTCTVLVLLGRFISPAGYSPDWWDQVNRGMGIMAIWLTAGTGGALARRTHQLSALYREVFEQVESRKRTEQLLRASEERMRLAMESGGLGARDVNLEDGTEVWSETHFRICGYEPAAGGAATGPMLDGLIHPDDLTRALDARHRARTERTIYHVAYRIRRADTLKTVWIEVWGRYYYAPTGAAVRFIGVCFDITGRKDLERKELERAVLEITTKQQQLIGQDLHDGLGQELTGLGLMAKTLAERAPDGALDQRIASRLVTGLDAAHRVVRELARGLIAIEVDPKGLTAALNELAKWTTAHTGVPVRVGCPAAVDLPDPATATHVFRIAQEAVSNALRHGRPRRIDLTLRSAAGGLRLTIVDDGTGLRSKADEGPGLGIRIMTYRAGLLGGELELDAPEGGGTSVTLTLPPGTSNDHAAPEPDRVAHLDR